MSKSKFQTVYGIRLYPMNYLMNEELTESDLNHLLDTLSLKYSIIIGMFRHIGSSKRNCDIIKMVKTNPRWVYEHYWTTSQRQEFEDMLTQAYKNIYYYKDIKARSLAQWMLFRFGLSIKGNKFDPSK